MSEFWKSIPKIYCKFCNVWYHDNRSSRDFHERSFKHKNNINRHIYEVQRDSVKRQKEDDAFKLELQRIEQAAMIAYEKDLGNTASCSSFKSPSSVSINDKLKDSIKEEKKNNEPDDFARKEALEMVTNKLKKKHEWYESKTAEGKIYYYNRLTMETKWSIPKTGFISIDEQKELNLIDVPGDQSKSNDEETQKFKHEQFQSTWTSVSNKDDESINVDLQLPKIKTKRKFEINQKLDEPVKIEFKEKVLNSEFSFKKKNQDVGFKKRKFNSKKIKTED